MNQPAHQTNWVSAPNHPGETLPQTLVADACCVVRQLALFLGGAVRIRFSALFRRAGVEQTRRAARVRPSHALNLG